MRHDFASGSDRREFVQNRFLDRRVEGVRVEPNRFVKGLICGEAGPDSLEYASPLGLGGMGLDIRGGDDGFEVGRARVFIRKARETGRDAAQGDPVLGFDARAQ